MRHCVARKTIGIRVALPLVFLCASVPPLMADESHVNASILANETLRLMSDSQSPESATPPTYPLMLDHDGGLDFDLGGSETQKLQLQLNQPLSLYTGSRVRLLDNGANMLGLDATLNAPLNDNFSLSAGIDRELGNAQFQSLGSIQCMNGELRADSYTASGCRFVNEPISNIEAQRIDLGASFDFSNMFASVNWFNQSSGLDTGNIRSFSQPASRPVMGHNLLSPNLGNPLLAAGGGNPLQYLNSEASGVNLNFKVGIATDTSGDLQLGLAFTRVLDAGYEGLYSTGSEALSWTVAEPFNSARMNLEWSRGSISSGIQGFYRESVSFLNRNELDSLTTFDVHFTWRTPWNANLSVGASNVLNAGADKPINAENPPVDPLESIYGRIPYVRYKQDL
jgi:hypothetical protein